jgi:tRNA A-37 threonylcarbamoyl transferase component Bud32/ActR/RegA family two-component response regulator
MSAANTARGQHLLDLAGSASQDHASQPARLLVVHDDVAIRLRLAELLAREYPDSRVDTCSTPAAVASGSTARDYTAAVVIVDFAAPPAVGGPLAIVGELRAAARSRTVVVVGRNGDERSAVKAIRAGASDYWPLHSVDAIELVRGLREAHGAGAWAAARRHGFGVPGFRIVKELERSASAALYLAESADYSGPVALKVHRHRSASEASRAERDRFQRECQLLSQFNDRGVADVYGFGVTDEFHWLAMEYFPCGSLKARLRHPVTEAEALGYMTSITRPLIAIHAAGIVHRDLKPSNIMLRADDSVALIDFGLARPALASSSVTAPNVRVGSPLYMSPEQVDGLPPDARCDLYALGVVLHELLTGRVPYAGDSVAMVLEQQRNAAPPRLAGRLQPYQPLLDALMAKAPTARMSSASAVLEALAELATDRVSRRQE